MTKKKMCVSKKMKNLILSLFQVPIDQLNRASRLLLGALLEAHDMLEQMHSAHGSVPQVEQSVKENIERVRRLSTEITLSEEPERKGAAPPSQIQVWRGEGKRACFLSFKLFLSTLASSHFTSGDNRR